jgi:hypothetical protein
LLRHCRSRNKINKFVRGRLVDVHPDLKRSQPERPVDEHRDRHTVEAADPGDLVRGDLSKSESAMREVPERSLAI